MTTLSNNEELADNKELGEVVYHLQHGCNSIKCASSGHRPAKEELFKLINALIQKSNQELLERLLGQGTIYFDEYTNKTIQAVPTSVIQQELTNLTGGK